MDMEKFLLQVQQANQAEEREARRRGRLGRIAIFLLIIFLLIRFLGEYQGGVLPLPPAIAQSQRGGAVSAASPARVEWIGGCDPGRVGLAVYASTDIPCSPSRVIGFPDLQTRLLEQGLLLEGEYLLTAPAPLSPACRVHVVSAASGQIVGWLCADLSGLYRTDASGQNPGPHAAVLADGSLSATN
jgi:hypothetical protein